MPTTELSVGSRADPHVRTSAAVDEEAELMRESTNLNREADEHVLLLTVG